jgi:hypothetical protein
MKNFGVSVNERQFLAAAKQLEERWLQLMKETGRNGMGLFLLAERPVATSDWSTLQARLWSLVVQQPNPALIKIDGPWVARVHLVPKEIFPIATHPLSYQVTFSVPFHANERQNLLDRVSAGASNARKFARGGVETARVLYIRLHEEAEITAYSEWVADLFCAEPDHPLDAVLLYQPALVQSDASDGESSSSLQHIVVTVGTQRFMSWRTASPARSPQITLPIGTVSDRPARRMLQNDKASVTLPPGYFYQSGDFYSCRPLFGAHHMGMMAPGLRRKFVLQGPEGELMISPISLPDGRFTLFD